MVCTLVNLTAPNTFSGKQSGLEKQGKQKWMGHTDKNSKSDHEVYARDIADFDNFFFKLTTEVVQENFCEIINTILM